MGNAHLTLKVAVGLILKGATMKNLFLSVMVIAFAEVAVGRRMGEAKRTHQQNGHLLKTNFRAKPQGREERMELSGLSTAYRIEPSGDLCFSLRSLRLCVRHILVECWKGKAGRTHQ